MDILILVDEQIKLAFGKSERFSIPDAAPTALLRCRAIMPDEKFVHLIPIRPDRIQE